jgi:hypothetical protein
VLSIRVSSVYMLVMLKAASLFVTSRHGSYVDVNMSSSLQ